MSLTYQPVELREAAHNTSHTSSSSRLVKHQEKKVLRQSVIILLVAAVVGVVFLAGLIPFLSRVVGLVAGNSDTVQYEDIVPPQVPSIAAPLAATNSASIVISGFSEPASEIILLHNDSQKNSVVADDTGAFKFTFSLSEGENVIAAFSRDSLNNESNRSRDYVVFFDASAPEISFENLEDGLSVSLQQNQNLAIKGSTEPKARVYLNDRLVFARKDGSFSTSYQLSEGENLLNFRVLDQAGNQTEIKRKVNFKL